jgi:hypothetical protein
MLEVSDDWAKLQRTRRKEGWPEILRTRQKVQLFETLRTLTWYHRSFTSILRCSELQEHV